MQDQEAASFIFEVLSSADVAQERTKAIKRGHEPKNLAELSTDERLLVRALAWRLRKDTDAQQACTRVDTHADADGRTTIDGMEPESDKSKEVELRVARSLAKTYKTVDELQSARNTKFSDLVMDAESFAGPSSEEDKRDNLGRLSFGLFDLTDQTSFLQILGSIFLQCGPVVCLTLMQIWPNQLKETLGQISNGCDSIGSKSPGISPIENLWEEKT